MTGITTEEVIDHYSSLAREDESKNTSHIQKVAHSFGYSPEDLSGVPEGANLGLSCGNPLAIAGLRAGETVLDLGSGAGFDVFQAAHKIGPTGLSIGVDMSTDMLARAQTNAENSSIKNVQFVHAPITAIPLEDGIADCVISNCVINLLPQDSKPLCFREVYRLLKPGGRVAVSDILAKQAFPEELGGHMALYVGCISGASLVSEYEIWLKEAGFKDIMIVDMKSDLNIYKERGQEAETEASSCCAPSSTSDAETKTSSCCAPVASESTCCGSATMKDATQEAALRNVADIDFNEWVSSYSIYAVKPDLV